MSKISKEGYEQILVNKAVFIPKGKKSKNIDGDYNKVNVFESVKQEFEAIAGIVEQSAGWMEVE